MGIEVVTISLTDSTGAIDPTGATVTITNTDLNVTLLSTTWQGEPIIANISTNTNYTVSVSAVDGVQPSSQSYKAGWKTARSITFDYMLGTFIESTDHQLYTAAQWPSAGKTANAIVILSNNCNVRMALEYGADKKAWKAWDGVDLTTYGMVIKSSSEALNDFDGEGNTNKLVAMNTATSTNTTEYAAPYCNNYIFPDGTTRGFLPSTGQWNLIIQNKTQVNSCLSACGKSSLAEDKNIWTSTCSATAQMFAFTWNASFQPAGLLWSLNVYPCSNYD